MTDKYLEWLENQITEMSDTKRQYTKLRIMSVVRDIEKMLETLGECKRMYLECEKEQSPSSGYGIDEDASWSEVAPDAWGMEGE